MIHMDKHQLISKSPANTYISQKDLGKIENPNSMTYWAFDRIKITGIASIQMKFPILTCINTCKSNARDTMAANKQKQKQKQSSTHSKGNLRPSFAIVGRIKANQVFLFCTPSVRQKSQLN
uniref:Uncharacterized protein n=2 Tax=Opuntia streptacantha TaxID=393608 RepID=A0A7C9A8A7_OPUST